MHIARETAGAARTRSSLRPVFEGKVFFQNFGRDAPRECEVVFRPINIIARSVATKQSILPCCRAMDCFAGARNDAEKAALPQFSPFPRHDKASIHRSATANPA